MLAKGLLATRITAKKQELSRGALEALFKRSQLRRDLYTEFIRFHITAGHFGDVSITTLSQAT